MVHLIPGVTTYKAAILTGSHDVIKGDSAHLSAAAFYLSLGEAPVGILMITIGTRITSHIDRLCLTPPHIREEMTIKCDIGENHIGDRSFITILNAYTTVARRNHTVVNHYTGNGVHILGTNLDGT